MQLTSRSFTTLEPDELDEARSSESAETTHGRDQPDDSGSRLTPIGRKPSVISQSDEATQTDISMVDSEKLLLTSLQPTYKTSLYIDSWAPSVKVPFQEDAEVMVVLEGLPRRQLDSKLVSPPQNSDGGHRKLFRSTLEIVSSRAANGHMTLTPVIPRSADMTGGRPGGQGSPEVMSQGSLGQQEWTLDVSGRRHVESMVCRSLFDSVTSLLRVACGL